MRGGFMNKVIEVLKSVWSLVMGIVWLGVVGGLGLLLLAIRALLIRKDGDKS